MLLRRAPVNIHPFFVVELMLQINKFYGDKNTVTNILFGGILDSGIFNVLRIFIDPVWAEGGGRGICMYMSR